MIEQKIDTIIHRLPHYLKREVLNYVEYLSQKHQDKRTSDKNFTFDWEGGLGNLQGMSSVELQHKALDWR